MRPEVQGHNLRPDGERTRLWCGHYVDGHVPYGTDVECSACARELLAESLFYDDHPACSWDRTVLPHVREWYLEEADRIGRTEERT